MQSVEREINQKPGACVCVALWYGTIVFYKPQNYNAYAQGDTPEWQRLQSRGGKRNGNDRQHHTGHSLDGDRAVRAGVLPDGRESNAG